MAFQRISTALQVGSGAVDSKRLAIPVNPGKCARIHLVRYVISTVRVTVPTLVQSVVGLTPSEEFNKDRSPFSLDWWRDPRFWLPHNFQLHIGSTADEAFVHSTAHLPIPGGLDVVGPLWYMVHNVNWDVNPDYFVEILYEEADAPGVARRQMRVRERRAT